MDAENTESNPIARVKGWVAEIVGAIFVLMVIALMILLSSGTF